ncbi:hypothetical protein GCM10020219_015720 [Nonomuraea dietziae]
MLAIELTLSVRSFHTPDTPRTSARPAQLALGADLAGDSGDLVGEGRQLVDHRVEGVLELEDLALGVDGDLLGQVALGDGGGDGGDLADLVGEVVGHEVDVVGEVLPDPRHAADLRLAAQLALCADLSGDSGHLFGEGGELVDHRVDGVLQLEHLADRVDGHLAAQVALRHGGGHLGDVAHLRGHTGRHGVDGLGQVAPAA